MRLLVLTIMLLLTLVMMPDSAYALQRTLSGDATLSLQEYSGESQGTSQKASSITQQYTATFSQKDKLFDGRAGAYTLMAGYEVNLLNPTYELNGVRDNSVTDIRTDKFYYDGQLVIAPGGLPFRLTLFARDTKRTTFIADSTRFSDFGTGSQAVGGNIKNGHMIEPDIDTDINNGTQQVFGGTLLLGIRNGTYLGDYRDVLSKLPRLLIDYKQENTKDLSSVTRRVNNRTRDLAFVSLNKKENWLHFRMMDHTDYLNPDSNALRQQVILGTVDQNLKREWINLTNWIKISGDLSYTHYDSVKDINPTETYLLNLMAVGRRDDLTTSVLSEFSRENDGQFSTVESTLPVFVTMKINRQTLLRSRVIYEGREQSYLEGGVIDTDSFSAIYPGTTDFQDLYLDNQLELQHSPRITFKPRIEIETRRENNTRDGMAVRIGSEILNNIKLSSTLIWLGGYNLTVFNTNDKSSGESQSYVQNEVYGRFDMGLTRTWKIGGSSSLKTGSGEGAQVVGFQIPAMSSRLSSGNSAGKMTTGEVSLYLDHQYQRFANRLAADFEFLLTEDGTFLQQTSLQHSLSYDKNIHRLDWHSDVTFGDTYERASTVDLAFVNVDGNPERVDASWSSDGKYRYNPNRKIAFSLFGGLGGEQGDSTRIAYKLSEELVYRVYTSNGIVRSLAEFSEEFGIEKVSRSNNGRSATYFGRFSASYFPTRHIYGRIRSEVTNFSESSAFQKINLGEIGFNFQKLHLTASYTDARKDRESDLLPAVTERRWEVKVKKIF